MRLVMVASAVVCIAACSGDPATPRSPGKPATSGTGAGGSAGGGGAGMTGTFHNVDGGTRAPNCAMSGPNDDHDADGFSPAQGDCNDCRADIHLGAREVPSNNIDEDCNGTDIAETPPSTKDPMPIESCDDGLALDSQDAMDGARAIGLCAGVLEAQYSDAVGNRGLASPLQVGLLPRFGAVPPREGERLLLLSSGVARTPADPGYTAGCDDFSVTPGVFPLPDTIEPSEAPDGYPKPPPAACGFGDNVPMSMVFDPAALSLRLQAPEDARGFTVEYSFYTSEYPLAVCDVVNDSFLLLMDPPPPGADHGNVAFDADGNPISVNTSLFRVCAGPPEETVPTAVEYDCPLGDAALADTGYDGNSCPPHIFPGGATGWLSTSVAIAPGSTFTLRFAVMDAGDGNYDSSVIVDRFRWLREDSSDPPPREVPITRPVPE